MKSREVEISFANLLLCDLNLISALRQRIRHESRSYSSIALKQREPYI